MSTYHLSPIRGLVHEVTPHCGGEHCRPVVVIDPEDREQIGHLIQAVKREFYATQSTDAMQAALRSLIAPPKPPEPQGLGAVVEDDKGVPWVRCENANLLPHWYGRNRARDYSAINAVRILSEGVQP